jgi:hypothetical protein
MRPSLTREIDARPPTTPRTGSPSPSLSTRPPTAKRFEVTSSTTACPGAGRSSSIHAPDERVARDHRHVARQDLRSSRLSSRITI